MAEAKDGCTWEERLQDWIDGDLDSEVLAEFLRHTTGCAICRERLATLQSLDAQLSEALPVEMLSEAFDKQVLQRVDLSAKADRAATRARLDREREEQLAELAASWRKVSGLAMLSALAAISLLIAVAAPVEMLLPGQVSFLGRIITLAQQPTASVAVVFSLAVTCTALALLVVRFLSLSEG